MIQQELFQKPEMGANTTGLMSVAIDDRNY